MATPGGGTTTVGVTTPGGPTAAVTFGSLESEVVFVEVVGARRGNAAAGCAAIFDKLGAEICVLYFLHCYTSLTHPKRQRCLPLRPLLGFWRLLRLPQQPLPWEEHLNL